MGSSNENSAYGPVRNPVDPERVPGGSSGGSAAAVAANMAVATLGTDTGGSIRQPASFCGVVGVLPTYGRVSRYGLIAFASSLDRIGPFAGNVRDAATLLSVIAGHDPCDATSSPAPVADYAAESDKGADGLRIGVPAEYFGEGLDPEVRERIESGIEALKAAGCTIKPISLPHTRYAIPTYYVVATAEASANLARFDGVRYGYRSPSSATLSDMYSHSRDEGFGAEVKRRIMLGTYALSAGYYDAYYLKAQQVRRILAEEFLRAFADVDAIVTPTAPTPAFKLGEKADDPLAMYLADIYTVTASLAGICGVKVPCGATKAGLPVGMQVLARTSPGGNRISRGARSGGGTDLGSRNQACKWVRRRWIDCSFCVLGAFSGPINASPRKVHVVGLGAVKRVPYSRAGDPAGAAPGEDVLKIRPLVVDGMVKEWTAARPRYYRSQLRGSPRPPHQRRAARGKAGNPEQALGMAAWSLAAGRSRHRPHRRAEVAGLRSRRQPCGLVPRLRRLLRRSRPAAKVFMPSWRRWLPASLCWRRS